MTSLSLSHALSRSVQELLNDTIVITTTISKLCPKSYLYLYDFSAYLHLCPYDRFGTDRGRFSASCIRFHPEGHVSPTQRLVGVDKVLLFVRSIDRAEREVIGIELEEDDGANGLTEDWSKVGRVCQWLDEEQVVKARRKTRDGAPSQQEEGARQRESARLGLRARIAEAYVALEAMLEEEERSRPQSGAKKTDFPYEMAEDRYDGTTEGGAGQNTLSTCENRMVEDKAEIAITDSESTNRRSRARQLEASDIGEANPGGVCAIDRKTTTDHEESVAMDKGKKR